MPNHFTNELLKGIGVMILVSPVADELDDTSLADVKVLGAVHSITREAADRQLLEMVDDYLAENGPVAKGHRIVLDTTTYIRYS
jgi:hypothetical protein